MVKWLEDVFPCHFPVPLWSAWINDLALLLSLGKSGWLSLPRVAGGWRKGGFLFPSRPSPSVAEERDMEVPFFSLHVARDGTNEAEWPWLHLPFGEIVSDESPPKLYLLVVPRGLSRYARIGHRVVLADLRST